MLLSVRLVRDSREVAEATDDLHLIRIERRLHPEGASGPTLTGKAVTDGNHKRIASHFQTKLPTVTGGFSGSHRYETMDMQRKRTITSDGGSPLVPRVNPRRCALLLRYPHGLPPPGGQDRRQRLGRDPARPAQGTRP